MTNFIAKNTAVAAAMMPKDTSSFIHGLGAEWLEYDALEPPDKNRLPQCGQVASPNG